MAIQDKITEEIVCVVKCFSFEEMEEDEFKEYEKVIITLTSMKKGANCVKFNEPLKIGKMYALR